MTDDLLISHFRFDGGDAYSETDEPLNEYDDIQVTIDCCY